MMVQDDGAKLEGRGNGIVAVKTIQPCGQMVAGNRSWLPHVLGSAISKAAQLADFPRIGSARVNINVSFLIIV
jgi:hypothetical protein